MRTNEFTISTKVEPVYCLIKLDGSISIETFKPFEKELDDLVSKKIHIIIDLSGVVYIDSASLGIIILQYKKAERNNKFLVISNIHPNIAHLFNLSGLEKKIKIFSDTEEAVEFIQDK